MKEQIDLAIKEDKVFLGGKLQDDWYQAFAEWSGTKDNNLKHISIWRIAI